LKTTNTMHQQRQLRRRNNSEYLLAIWVRTDKAIILVRWKRTLRFHLRLIVSGLFVIHCSTAYAQIMVIVMFL